MSVLPPGAPPQIHDVQGPGDPSQAEANAIYGMLQNDSTAQSGTPPQYTYAWHQVAADILAQIPTGYTLDQVKAAINGILTPTPAPNVDVFMKYNLSQNDLTDQSTAHPDSFYNQLYSITSQAGYDSWMPDLQDDDYTQVDSYYRALMTVSVPNDVAQLRQDLASDVYKLGSNALGSDVENAYAKRVFNTDFYKTYPLITSSNMQDVYNLFFNAHMSMPPGIQQLFTNFLISPTYVTGTNPTVNAWLSEVQSLWVNGSTNPVADLATWADDLVVKTPASFFSANSGISVTDFSTFLTMSGVPPSNSDVTNVLVETGNALATMSATDPGQSFYSAFLSQAANAWNTGGNMSTLQSWLNNIGPNGTGIFDSDFVETYLSGQGLNSTQVGQLNTDIIALLKFVNLAPSDPNLSLQYFSAICVWWPQGFPPGENTLANVLASELRNAFYQPGMTVATFQNYFEQKYVTTASNVSPWASAFPSAAAAAAGLADVLNQIGVTIPPGNFMQQYIWTASNVSSQDAPMAKLLNLLLTDMQKTMSTGGASWPSGTLTQVQQDAIAMLTNYNSIAGITETDLSNFLTNGLGEGAPDTQYGTAYTMLLTWMNQNQGNNKMGADMMSYMVPNLSTGVMNLLPTWIVNEVFGGYDYKDAAVGEPSATTVNGLMKIAYYSDLNPPPTIPLAPTYFSNITNIEKWLANPSSMTTWNLGTPDPALINLIKDLSNHLMSIWPDSAASAPNSWTAIQNWVQATSPGSMGWQQGQIFEPGFFTNPSYAGLDADDLRWLFLNPLQVPTSSMPPMLDNYGNAGAWLANPSTDAAGVLLAQYLVNDIKNRWNDATGLADLATDVQGQILAPLGSSDFFHTYQLTTGDIDDFNTFMSYGNFTPPDTNLANAYFNFGTWNQKGDADAPLYSAFLTQTFNIWTSTTPPPSGVTLFMQLQDWTQQNYINTAFLSADGKQPPTFSPPTYSEASVNNMETWLNAAPSSHFTPPDQKVQDALFSVYTWMGTDTTQPKYQFGIVVVRYAFLQTPGNNWPVAWPTGGMTNLNGFVNDWFNPPPGGGTMDDPFLWAPEVPASDIETLFTNMGLTLTPYSTPSLIDQYAESAGSYLQNTILAAGGPGSTSIDAQFFNAFMAMYQSAGSQQAAGIKPDLNTTILPWVENVLYNNFSEYPGLQSATKTEFYSEVNAYYKGVTMYQDRNYLQDTWMTQWPAAPPAPAEDPYQFNKLFGNNLLTKMNDYLNPSNDNSPVLAGFQPYISSFFFRDIPNLFPSAGPQTPGYPPPGLQFSDVTTLLSKFNSFTSYPTYAAWEVVVNDRNNATSTAGEALFQTLMDQFNTVRYKVGVSTVATTPTFWRDDPSIQTNIVPLWMTPVTQGTTSWQDGAGNAYTWSSSPPVPSLADQTAFQAIMNMQGF